MYLWPSRFQGHAAENDFDTTTKSYAWGSLDTYGGASFDLHYAKDLIYSRDVSSTGLYIP